jgi:hypothetical protein
MVGGFANRPMARPLLLAQWLCASALAALAWIAAAGAETFTGTESEALEDAAQLDAYRRWKDSPHGAMLRRILPPGPRPEQLPEPESPGARVMARYCVQCHYLPSPAMHSPEKWPKAVERMVPRMQGKGNMGTLMHEMMVGVQAPTRGELEALLAYLRRHGQAEIERSRYPDLATPDGRAYDLACSQCHALPDPERHPAREWPEVVERMKKHLRWVGTVRGRLPNPAGELKEEQIVRFLQRHAR